jgi:hypothetical protein
MQTTFPGEDTPDADVRATTNAPIAAFDVRGAMTGDMMRLVRGRL